MSIKSFVLLASTGFISYSGTRFYFFIMTSRQIKSWGYNYTGSSCSVSESANVLAKPSNKCRNRYFYYFEIVTKQHVEEIGDCKV